MHRFCLHLRSRLATFGRPATATLAVSRLGFFAGGIFWRFILALASPIEPLAALLLQVHMVQHLLLTMVAPPLVWLGAPLLPMLWGLPKPIRTHWIAPLLRSAGLRQCTRLLTHPALALALFVATNLLWHVPASYELALRSSGWHYVQHACFFAAGLIFWYPVIRPYPSHPRWSLWLLLPYLILADIQNTVLAALLTFSSKVLYPYYAQVPRIENISPLEDQAVAGVIMWVPGSVAFLGPLGWIGLRLLYGTAAENKPSPARRVETKPYSFVVLNSGPAGSQSSACSARTVSSRRHFTTRLLSTFFRWRYARMTLQVPLLILAAVGGL